MPFRSPKIRTHSKSNRSAYNPNFSQTESTRFFVSPSISIIAGHGLLNPSAFHFRVASIPIFDP